MPLKVPATLHMRVSCTNVIQNAFRNTGRVARFRAETDQAL